MSDKKSKSDANKHGNKGKSQMADYEIIKPKVDLRKKIKVLPSSSDYDPVAKAEQAMQRLSVNFGMWMNDEVGKLQATWKKLDQQELTSDGLQELFRSAHDIKGQAHTMGFPIAGLIAGSLCELIENVPNPADLPKTLLLKHVQAIAAVVNEDAREEDNAVGRALANELIKLSEEVVAKFGSEES